MPHVSCWYLVFHQTFVFFSCNFQLIYSYIIYILQTGESMNVFWNCTILIIIFTFSFIFKNNINLYYLFLHHYFCGSFFFVPSFLLSSVLSFSLTMLHVRCCPRVRWFSDRSWIQYITDDEIHSSQRIWQGQFAPPPNLVPGPTPLPVWRDCHDHMEYTQGPLANTRTLYLSQSRPQTLHVFSRLTGITKSRNEIASVSHFFMPAICFLSQVLCQKRSG